MNFSNSLRIVARFVIIDGDRLQAMIKASKEDFFISPKPRRAIFFIMVVTLQSRRPCWVARICLKMWGKVLISSRGRQLCYSQSIDEIITQNATGYSHTRGMDPCFQP